MTAVKVKSEIKTILNLNAEKYSKHHIRQILQECPVVSLEEGNGEITLYLNQIKIGMYSIVLLLPLDSSKNWNKLKDYGDFQITIYDSEDPDASSVNLKKDVRFKNLPWVAKNFFGQFHIKHLVEAVCHCSRLNRLKAFI